jgi:hypothetical protein
MSKRARVIHAILMTSSYLLSSGHPRAYTSARRGSTGTGEKLSVTSAKAARREHTLCEMKAAARECACSSGSATWSDLAASGKKFERLVR